MYGILASLLVLVLSGFLSLLLYRRESYSSVTGAGGAVLGAICGVIAVTGFFTGFLPELSFGNWIHMDRLGAFFLYPVFVIGAFAAVHSLGYISGYGRKTGVYWFFFNLMLASMVWVVVSSSSVEFIFAWEMMGIMSFALVMFNYHSVAVRRASWIYLLACHTGGILLLLFFIYSDKIAQGSGLGLFLIFVGMAGFGLKAGFGLLHVWLPEAHPAAPAPVSAIMSAAMINLGIYGILRYVVPFGGSAWVFGWAFLVLGMSGAFFGVLFALAQCNLKRLLAYSSVENMGIISMGLGLGFLGAHYEIFSMSIFGFAGAFLHLLNHAVLKGALFLAAGSVFKSTGVLNMDKLGGLMKRLPFTGGVFAISSISICGFPPFNGFLGEFLIYMAAFFGVCYGGGMVFAASLCAVIVLGLVGALSLVAFGKAVSAVFLGEPREVLAAAVGGARWMAMALGGLLILQLGVTVGAPLICLEFAPLIEMVVDIPGDELGRIIQKVSMLLSVIGWTSVILCAFFGGLFVIRRLLPGDVRKGITWDCGYARPTARMEYTGSAFTQPLTDFFAILLHQKKELMRPDGLFPHRAEIKISTEDIGERMFWRPLFVAIGKFAVRVHKLQSGYLHFYILTMVMALVAMLIWGFGFDGGEVNK